MVLLAEVVAEDISHREVYQSQECLTGQAAVAYHHWEWVAHRVVAAEEEEVADSIVEEEVILTGVIVAEVATVSVDAEAWIEVAEEDLGDPVEAVREAEAVSEIGAAEEAADAAVHRKEEAGHSVLAGLLSDPDSISRPRNRQTVMLLNRRAKEDTEEAPARTVEDNSNRSNSSSP